MNIYQCQEKAKNLGFDKAKFIAHFPAGPVECQWLGAYFGIFKIDKIDGVLRVNKIDEYFPDLVVTEPYLE